MKAMVIAGTNSGCGKTTVTLGIMAALRKKGLAVQPFKAGPDFIDAGLHRLVADRPSRNLDQWMCGTDYVVDCLTRHAVGADISVIEGVMGMYDGEFSTASLAGLLRAPVILVVDGYGMAESAGAVVHGFAQFKVQSSKLRVKLGGVIFNRVASESHYKRLKDSVLDVPVLGYLPRESAFEIPHRHLGLTIAEDDPITKANTDKLADAVSKYINVDAIIRSSEVQEQGQITAHREDARYARETGQCRIAVAYDKAFSFYYEDNLDSLRDAGAEVIRFSLTEDNAIPSTADAVYMGGGYPELHADALSRNADMLSSVRTWAGTGKPLYAECGGLMYLSKGIYDFDGKFFAMTGVFPFETRMTKKPRLGYREVLLNEDCIIGSKGERLRGHEFHYSELDEKTVQGPEFKVQSKGQTGLVYSVHDSQGQERGNEGYRYKNTLASYVHVHFGSNRSLASHFVDFVKGVITK